MHILNKEKRQHRRNNDERQTANLLQKSHVTSCPALMIGLKCVPGHGRVTRSMAENDVLDCTASSWILQPARWERTEEVKYRFRGRPVKYI